MSFQPPEGAGPPAPGPEQPTPAGWGGIPPAPGRSQPGWGPPPGIPGQQPPAGPPSTRPLRWLVISGVVVLLCAIASIVRGATTIDTSDVRDLVEDPASVLEFQTDHPGSWSGKLEEGRYWVFAIGPNLIAEDFGSTPRDGFSAPELTVRGEDGTRITVDRPGEEVNVGGLDNDLVLVGEFRVRRTAEYQVVSKGGSPGIEQIGAGGTGALWDATKAIIGPVGWIILGVVLGLLSLALLAIALILWLVWRSRTP